MKKKKLLKILLVILIAIFLTVGIIGVLLVGHRKSVQKQESKAKAMAALESIPKATPTPAVTVTPTPTPIPTATPTPVPVRKPAFDPAAYQDDWHSSDGLASLTIYDISSKSVSFYFSQGNKKGTAVCEADVTADVAGNAASFSFKDSLGNRAKGSLTFDSGQLYVKISTSKQAEGASVSPSVNCIMLRGQVELPKTEEEQKPEQPETKKEMNMAVDENGYYFPDSDSRYLTDEELSSMSASDLELAKNEIYARRGRKFVTESIAAYFNSKSWYQGTIEPEEFDAAQDSIFNEYETSNIMKIVEWEKKKEN